MRWSGLVAMGLCLTACSDGRVTVEDGGEVPLDASAAPDAWVGPSSRDAAVEVTPDAERAPDAEPAPDAAVACPSTTTVTLDRDRVALEWWPHEPPPLAALALHASDPACAALIADSDAPWLLAAADPRAAALTLRVVGARVVSGDHRATVALRGSAGGPALATVMVTLRALVPPRAGAARRVLAIGLDGVRADALSVARTPHLDRLAAHGYSTLEAYTQQTGPTLSGPGWSSIFTGVESSRHRIIANVGWDRFDRQYRTFMARARSDGYRTAAACSWTPILDDLLEDDALDWSARGSDDAVAAAMAMTLASGLHDVHYVHFNDPDANGHASGFATYNPAYVGAIEAEDAASGG